MDIQVNTEIPLPRSNWDSSPFPWITPLWITFLPFISQNILLNINDVEFDFSMGCILVLFSFLWIINVLCSNFGFLKLWFFFLNKRYLLTLIQNYNFIIEITLKQLLLTKYGWNNRNWGRLIMKNPKLHFFDISGSSKFIVNINVQINVTRSIFFGFRFFFLNACNNVLYHNQ